MPNSSTSTAVDSLLTISPTVRDFNRFPKGVKTSFLKGSHSPHPMNNLLKGNCRNQESQFLQMDIVENVEIQSSGGSDVDALADFLRPFI